MKVKDNVVMITEAVTYKLATISIQEKAMARICNRTNPLLGNQRLLAAP